MTDDIHPERIAGYIDGYEAALETVKSLRIRITTAPGAENCNMNDAIALGISEARKVLESSLEKLQSNTK